MSDFLSFAARRLANDVLARLIGIDEVASHQRQPLGFRHFDDADKGFLTREAVAPAIHGQRGKAHISAVRNLPTAITGSFKACDGFHALNRNTP